MASYTSPGAIGSWGEGTDRLRHPDDGAVCRLVSKTVAEANCRGVRDGCTESAEGCGRKLLSLVFADTLAFPSGNPLTALFIPSDQYISLSDKQVGAIKAANDDTIRAYPPESGYGPPNILRSGRNGRPALACSANTVLAATMDERTVFSNGGWTMWAVAELDDTRLAYGVYGPVGFGNHGGYGMLFTDDASAGAYFRHTAAQMAGNQQYGFHTFVLTMFDGSVSFYVDGVAQTLSSRPSLELIDDNTLYIGANGVELEGMGYSGWVYEGGFATSRWTPTHVSDWNAYAQQMYMNTEATPRSPLVCCPTKLIQREYDPDGGKDVPEIPPPPEPPG